MAIEFLEEEDVSAIHIVDDDLLVGFAQSAVAARITIAEAQLQENTAKEKLGFACLGIAVSDLDAGKYTGSVRVQSSESLPIRVEMRLKKGNMRVSEEQRLGEAFGPIYTDLFQRIQEIQRITDVHGLISAMRKDGINPWKHLTVVVREDADTAILAKYKQHVIAREMIAPMKGFFATLNEFSGKLKTKAVNFLKEYLPHAIDPTVVLGTRGRK